MSLPQELRDFGFVMKRKPVEMGRNEKLIRRVLGPLVNVIEAVISVYVSILIAPIFFILWLINEFVRVMVITPLLRLKFGAKVKLVPAGEDNIWSFKKPGNSRNILMLTVFRNEIDLEEYRQNFTHRVLDYTDKLGRRPYRKLMQILFKKFGYCCWKKDDNFDIKNHINMLNVDKDFVTESDLYNGILTQLTKNMSSEHPQWEEIIIPKFVYDCDVIYKEEEEKGSGVKVKLRKLKSGTKIKSAKIFRFHHSYMEGLSAFVMLKTCMVDGPFDCSIDPLTPLKMSFWEKCTQILTVVFFGTSKMIGNIFAELNADSRFSTPKFSHKITHGWSELIEMKIIQKIQEEMNCSAGEILTCALGGALRAVSEEFCKKPEWLLFGDSFEESVYVGLVKFVLPHPSEGPLNRFGVVGVGVNTASLSLRLDRLKLTKDSYQQYVRESPVILLNNWLMRYIGRFPQIIIQKLLTNSGAPVVFSNIPRIKNKVTLMGQLEVEEFGGWMPMLTSTGVGVTTAKYGDKMRLCGVTETGCLCQDELNYLLRAMRNEILMMAEECS